MSDNLSKIFNVATLPSTEVIEMPVSKVPSNVSSDADFARSNLRELIKTATTALQHALDVAVQSESPRAYEVLATLINSSADLNTKLVDVHQKEQRIATDKTAPQASTGPVNQTITNNVVFSGTSTELNELIAKQMLTVREPKGINNEIITN